MSVMNPNPQDAYLAPSQAAPPPGRRSGECPPRFPCAPRGHVEPCPSAAGSGSSAPPDRALWRRFVLSPCPPLTVTRSLSQGFWTGTPTAKVSAGHVAPTCVLPLLTPKRRGGRQRVGRGSVMSPL